MKTLNLLREDLENYNYSDLDLSEVTNLKIWYCKNFNWNKIKDFKKLKELIIAGYDGNDLADIFFSKGLEKLSIVHLPNVTSLSGVENLENLKELELMTLPTWDSSKKYQTIDSIIPITKLNNLIKLNSFGIEYKDSNIKEIVESMKIDKVTMSGPFEFKK